MTELKIHLTPKANHNVITGWKDPYTLNVRVTAPPENGKANKALIKMLSKTLRLPQSALTIKSGQISRNKTIRIEGVEKADLRSIWAKE